LSLEGKGKESMSDEVLLFNNRISALFRGTEYRPVSNREEMERACRLVYRRYLWRGYLSPDYPYPFKISLHNALPQTVTFIALLRREVVATAVLIPDSPLGLPMEQVYKAEIDSLRNQHRKIAEVSMLASNPDVIGKYVSMMLGCSKLFVMLGLFKVLFDYACEKLGLDDLCIAIHPRHLSTYRFLLFERFGETKAYPGAGGNPAVAKRLDIKQAQEKCRPRRNLYRMFFVRKTNSGVFEQKITLTPSDLRYFFVEKTDIFKRATPSQMDYVRCWYPDYDFNSICA
jgi:hypothetical protein